MQIKTTVRFHYTPPTVTKLTRSTIASAGKNVEELGPLPPAGRSNTCTAAPENGERPPAAGPGCVPSGSAHRSLGLTGKHGRVHGGAEALVGHWHTRVP